MIGRGSFAAIGRIGRWFDGDAASENRDGGALDIRIFVWQAAPC